MFIPDKRRLFTVRRAAIHLGSLFPVGTEHIQSDRHRKLRLPTFLGNLDIARIKLPVTVRFQDPENIPDNLLLSVNQFKGLLIEFTLRMLQLFNESTYEVSLVFIVMRCLCHEPCGLVIMQSSQRTTSPMASKKPHCCDLIFQRDTEPFGSIPLPDFILHSLYLPS